jgi:hypothetical protein
MTDRPQDVIRQALRHWQTKAEAYHALLKGASCQFCHEALLSGTGPPCQHHDKLRRAIVVEPFDALDPEAALSDLITERDRLRALVQAIRDECDDTGGEFWEGTNLETSAELRALSASPPEQPGDES